MRDTNLDFISVPGVRLWTDKSGRQKYSSNAEAVTWAVQMTSQGVILAAQKWNGPWFAFMVRRSVKHPTYFKAASMSSKKQRKLYPCEVCPFVLHNQSDLRDHILSVHLNTKKYQCEICDNILSTEAGLRIHTREMHFKKKRCGLCDYASATPTRMRLHVRAVHEF